MELMDLIREFGPLAACVIWFLYRDGKREDRLSNRIEMLETEQREIILPLVEKSTQVIAQNTMVMKRLEEAVERTFQNER